MLHKYHNNNFCSKRLGSYIDSYDQCLREFNWKRKTNAKIRAISSVLYSKCIDTDVLKHILSFTFLSVEQYKIKATMNDVLHSIDSAEHSEDFGTCCKDTCNYCVKVYINELHLLILLNGRHEADVHIHTNFCSQCGSYTNPNKSPKIRCNCNTGSYYTLFYNMFGPSY